LINSGEWNLYSVLWEDLKGNRVYNPAIATKECCCDISDKTRSPTEDREPMAWIHLIAMLEAGKPKRIQLIFFKKGSFT
jgi:hypothetical protein